MNPSIQKLYEICQKEEKIILGLMSGTSIDGLDMALCKFRGSGTETSVEVLHFTTVPFEESFKKKVRSIFAKEEIHFPDLSTLNVEIALKHAEIIHETLQKWGVQATEVDIIASHGQTVMHRPMRDHSLPNSTLQIGDGDHLAIKTGIITLSDFRQKHVAAGGEGAPLAIFGDYLLFGKQGENRILLNIGGIGNFTLVPGDLRPELIRVTDTGPGNTLIDALVRRYFPEQSFDKDAAIAKRGKVSEELLKIIAKDDFFKEHFPKSTGPEKFNLDWLNQKIADAGLILSPEDLICTISELTARSISEAIEQYLSLDTSYPTRLLVSGGGSCNPYIMERLQALNPTYSCEDFDVLGFDSSAKEAVLFALLANECLSDQGVYKNRQLGDTPWPTLGKISLPL
ncbi:MAG: Anhydro-N-acetylmuramic acid kinase [Bacteroidota bacterium]